MTLERNSENHNEVVDKFVDITADYEMSSYDYRIRASASNDAHGAITITLPPVAEAKGRFYAILARDADAHNTITIEDNNDDSECWIKDIALDGPCDGLVFYSDGLAWFPLEFRSEWPGVATTAPPGSTTAAPTTAQ